MNLNTSILKYIEDVKSGTFTVEEFTAATLQRIKDVDRDVHAYLSLNDSAINDAKKLIKKYLLEKKLDNVMDFLFQSKITFASPVLKPLVLQKY